MKMPYSGVVSFLIAVMVVPALLIVAPTAQAVPLMVEFDVTIVSGNIEPPGSMFFGSSTFDDNTITGVGFEHTPLTSLNFEFDGFTFPLDRASESLAFFADGNFTDMSYILSNNPLPSGEFNFVDWAGITFQYGVQSSFQGPFVRTAEGRVRYSEPRVVPEPFTVLLFGSGLASLAAWRYRRFVKS